MEQEERRLSEESCAALEARRLPRWSELPDLELYMDQVLSLVERYLGAQPGWTARGLTAAMVNNYVKMGALPPPVKKRYGRRHLARLLMLCVLKAALPLAAIQVLMPADADGEAAFYDGFCQAFEQAGRDAAAAGRQSGGAVLGAALRAQAEQALALSALS